MPEESNFSLNGGPAGASQRDRKLPARGTRGLFCWILLPAALGLLTACERQIVYIPAEWRTPPPVAESGTSHKETSQTRPSTAPKPHTGFEEKEIPSSSAATSAQEGKPAYQSPRQGAAGSQTQPRNQGGSSAAAGGAASPGAEESTPASANPKANASAGGPQRKASMHLVDTARTDMAHGNVDHAISLLEQAIQVDVNNGDAFYLLARGWYRKGAITKSLGFARKAEVLFQRDKTKLKQVLLFQSDLFKEKGDAEKSEACRKKANKL